MFGFTYFYERKSSFQKKYFNFFASFTEIDRKLKLHCSCKVNEQRQKWKEWKDRGNILPNCNNNNILDWKQLRSACASSQFACLPICLCVFFDSAPGRYILARGLSPTGKNANCGASAMGILIGMRVLSTWQIIKGGWRVAMHQLCRDIRH